MALANYIQHVLSHQNLTMINIKKRESRDYTETKKQVHGDLCLPCVYLLTILVCPFWPPLPQT